MNQKTSAKIIRIVKRFGVVRPKDMDAHGIPRKYIHQLHHEGILTRVGRGLYVLEGASPSENRTIAEVCKRVPTGVVCLLSALQFHRLTTQSPHEIWLAINHKARRPKEPMLPIRIARFSGKALATGIEQHTIEGVRVKVYSPAKTVADCFKYRNKIELGVAIEALRDCMSSRRCTMDELWEYARICRVSNVMKPYLESLI
ncbi:MAG: type IV toxin-antitoxin system AbiEi family antitoxin domain-containing protein [candidate division Zixibacteria bacterium]|nr:type IV toxin-antitoxin system AbiEi family antitoxin domain-containing protein [candidate division Zixibacteria bacterium]